MKSVRIRLPAESDPVGMCVEEASDAREGRDLLFKDGRVIAICYHYPGERRGYILRSGGHARGSLPNVEGNYRILLGARGAEVGRLQKAVRRLHREVGRLEAVPESLWPRLGLLTAQRGFRAYMASELLLATRQKLFLQESLGSDLRL
jgi:hypothetical protein